MKACENSYQHLMHTLLPSNGGYADHVQTLRPNVCVHRDCLFLIKLLDLRYPVTRHSVRVWTANSKNKNTLVYNNVTRSQNINKIDRLAYFSKRQIRTLTAKSINQNYLFFKLKIYG